MAHQLLYLKDQSHDTLSIIPAGGGLSALVMHWRGRHARAVARLAREQRKAARMRRRR